MGCGVCAISHVRSGCFPPAPLGTMALFFDPWRGRANQPFRTAHARCDALSHRSRRATSQSGSATRRSTARNAPTTRAHRRPCACPCNDPVEARHTHLAAAALRAKVPDVARRGLRPARLPSGALLDPARSRASADRSSEQPVDRVRHEKRRCADRQAGEPAVSAQRQSPRRSLPPAAAAYAARGKPRTALRVAQSPPPRRAAAQSIESSLRRGAGSGEFGALVRRLAQSPPRLRALRDAREVAIARTWLLQVGWRRHGLIDPADVP